MAAAVETRDQNIWRDLPFTLDNGYVPAVPRRWMFIGNSRGQQCRFECRLSQRHPSLPNVYVASAVCAHNLHYLCNDWVRLDQLEEIRA